jgi:sulfur dioxygenase
MVQSKGGCILLTTEKDAQNCTVANNEIGIRQLFDPESCTYTYLLWDKDTEDAVLIDPVDTQVERDLLVSTSLNVVFTINTHVHEDHYSGNSLLKQKRPGVKSVISKASGAKADVHIGDGDEIHFGNRFITARTTPGHTNGCLSFVLDDDKAVLTGDALLIRDCARCDLPESSPGTLYDSVHSKLYTLPDSTIVFPGHDYNDQARSTIGDEKLHNPLLGIDKNSRENFIKTMESRKMPYPKMMALTVPANMQDGAKPFFLRSLRTRIKERWAIFG